MSAKILILKKSKVIQFRRTGEATVKNYNRIFSFVLTVEYPDLYRSILTIDVNNSLSSFVLNANRYTLQIKVHFK